MAGQYSEECMMTMEGNMEMEEKKEAVLINTLDISAAG